ncbi:hypothetical protein V8E55_011082 [Tylopilus felleus]
MPSLRRSFSSPSVRSSPYPSTNSSIRTRAAPIHPRRGSPSATAERRVLADIEWWRVHDGQCDLDHTLEDPHEPDSDVPGGLVTLSAGGGSLEPPQTHSLSLDSMQDVYSNALAALSIAPYSPPATRHGRDSSVESSPELPTAPLETVQPPASPESFPYSDLFSFPSVLTRAGGRQAHPIFGLRSVSAPGLSQQRTLVPDFADMGGDSFSLDQNLFQ